MVHIVHPVPTESSWSIVSNVNDKPTYGLRVNDVRLSLNAVHHFQS